MRKVITERIKRILSLFCIALFMIVYSAMGTATADDEVLVKAAYNWRNNDGTEKKKAGINDVIVIQVQGLQKLLDQSQCLRNMQPVAGCTKQEIRLFLDGRKVPDVVPVSGAPMEDKGTLQFHLERIGANKENDETWADLLGMPPFDKGFFERETEISVGLDNGFAQPTEEKHFQLVRIRKSQFYSGLVLLILLLILILWLAKTSDILRDFGPPPRGMNNRGKPNKKPSVPGCWISWSAGVANHPAPRLHCACGQPLAGEKGQATASKQESPSLGRGGLP